MSNPAAGRQMPTCQGPGESDLAGNEEDAISLKCQCSGPNVAILEYRGEPSDPPKKVCSNLTHHQYVDLLGEACAQLGRYLWLYTCLKPCGAEPIEIPCKCFFN